MTTAGNSLEAAWKRLTPEVHTCLDAMASAGMIGSYGLSTHSRPLAAHVPFGRLLEESVQLQLFVLTGVVHLVDPGHGFVKLFFERHGLDSTV